MFDLAGMCDTVVEIGSQWGWWAWRALRQVSGSPTLYCVDPWPTDARSVCEYHGGEENFFDWQINLREFLGKRVFGIREKSSKAAFDWRYGKIDFLFIDGDHSDVYSDLCGWMRHVRLGGLIVGHDAAGPHGKAVMQGVRRYFKLDIFDGQRPSVVVDRLYYSASGRRLSPCWYVRKTWP
jgi:predicted O-methyltransferase YrrM